MFIIFWLCVMLPFSFAPYPIDTRFYVVMREGNITGFIEEKGNGSYVVNLNACKVGRTNKFVFGSKNDVRISYGKVIMNCSSFTSPHIFGDEGSVTVKAEFDTVYFTGVLLSVTVPDGNFINVVFDNAESSRSNHKHCQEMSGLSSVKTTFLGITGETKEERLRLSSSWLMPMSLHTNGNSFNFSLEEQDTLSGDFLSFTLRFYSSQQSGLSNLFVNKTTELSGTITPLGFDEKTPYAKDVQAIYDLHIGEDNVLLLTFPYFDLNDCLVDYLVVEAIRHCNSSVCETYLLGRFCETKAPKPLVLPKDDSITAPTYRFKFVTESVSCASVISRTGFKVVYSIHPKSQAPQQNEYGQFNCSVSDYASFEHHFRCNYETDCVNGEDEEGCQHEGTCGAGLMQAGDKCYRVWLVKGEISWYDASERCQSRGQELATPKTQREWNDFQTLWKRMVTTFPVFIGLTTSVSHLPEMYKDMLQWTDSTMALYVNVKVGSIPKPSCAFVPPFHSDFLNVSSCGTLYYVNHIICQEKSILNSSRQTLIFPSVETNLTETNLTHCPAGHVTQSFLSCDQTSHCGTDDYPKVCTLRESVELEMFLCDNGGQTFHYTLVCDHKQHCADNSDEKFCVFPGSSMWTCENVESDQPVLRKSPSDGQQLCSKSYTTSRQFVGSVVSSLPAPAVVEFDGRGGYNMSSLSEGQPCPETHFQCSSGYCLPVFLRCNDVADCPSQEDEMGCESYECQGFYRCRDSTICVHVNSLCDGVFQCPQKDDELLCDLECPSACSCQGLAFVCDQHFAASDHPKIRYLDARGSGMTVDNLTNNQFLVWLRLSECKVNVLPSVPWCLPNLKVLDLSRNNIVTVNVSMFKGMLNLKTLDLSSNPLSVVLAAQAEFSLKSLVMLSMSHTEIVKLEMEMLGHFPNLTVLNMSHSSLKAIPEKGFSANRALEDVDLRTPHLADFPHDLLKSLSRLKRVFTDNFKLCCPAFLPPHLDTKFCHSPRNELTSCADLLRSNFFRVFLWCFGVLAIVGNAGSFVVRICMKKSRESVKGFDVFVGNLCTADFLMGVYLIIIGTADAAYRGSYLQNDKSWREGTACKIAGFLSLLSSEVSALFICLITLDRFIVLRFPYSQVRFRLFSASVASGIAWAVGVVLAALPLLPMTSHWQFYSQTSICIPLPVTRRTFPGQAYSFAVFIIFNFVLFLLIAFGQVFIFLSVRKNSVMSTVSGASSREAALARKLSSIVVSDFFCWFPIGLLGLLAWGGTPIPGDVTVAVAIFVLPLNSALNPFLYTLNVILEKRREKTQAQVLRRLEASLASGKLHNRKTVSQQTTDGVYDTSVQDVACQTSSLQAIVQASLSEAQSTCSPGAGFCQNPVSDVVCDTSLQDVACQTLESSLEAIVQARLSETQSTSSPIGFSQKPMSDVVCDTSLQDVACQTSSLEAIVQAWLSDAHNTSPGAGQELVSDSSC